MDSKIYTQNKPALFYNMTRACNLRCRYCYLGDVVGKTKNPEQMISELNLLYDWIGPSSLILLGGEVTLLSGLFDVAKASRQIGFEQITLDTNGLFNQKVLDQITPEIFDEVCISLDGATEGLNNRTRPNSDLEIIVQNIKASQNRGIRVAINSVLGRLNISELKFLPKLLSELEVQNWYIQSVMSFGRAREIRNVELSEDEWDKAFKEITEESRKYDVNTIYPNIYSPKRDNFSCQGKENKVFLVDTVGRIYRCPIFIDTDMYKYRIIGKKIVENKEKNEQDYYDMGCSSCPYELSENNRKIGCFMDKCEIK